MQLSKFKLRLSATLVGATLINFGLPIFHVQFIAKPQVLAQSVEARKAEANRLLAQGIEQFRVSQFEVALQSWLQALTIYQELKDDQGEAATLGHIGLAYYLLRDYAKAIDYQQQSLTITQTIKDQHTGETSLRSLRNAYDSLSNDIKSQQPLLMNVQSSRETRPQDLGNQGLIYLSQGNLTRAIESQKRSLEMIRRENNSRQTDEATDQLRQRADKLRQQGIEQYRTNQFETALQSWQQALTLYKELKNRQEEGTILGHLGNAYYVLGDYSKATDYQQQRLAIALELHDREAEGHALGNLGRISKSSGNYPSAINYIQQDLAIARQIKDRRGEAQALSNLGNAYYFLGNYPKAIEYHQQSLVVAREIKDRRGEGQALANLGTDYYGIGELARAIDYQQQGLKIKQEFQDRLGEAQALNNLGLALLKQGNFVEAEGKLRRATEIWESLRTGVGSNDANKISFFETQIATYILLQKVLVAQNKTVEALEIAEQSRARAFVELLATRLTTPVATPSITPPKITKIQQIAKQQNSTIIEYSIIPDEFQFEGKRQAKESQLYIWVIKPTGEISFRAVDLKPLWQQQNTSLKDLVADVRCFDNVNCLNTTQIAQRGFNLNAQNQQAKPTSTPESRNKQLHQLHQLLIQPIADLLPSNPDAHVIFMPQGELFLVPFPALIDANNQYLIEKHTILTAPSIQTLDLTRQQRQKIGQIELQNSVVVGIPRGNAVVVGNPTMPSVSTVPGEEAKPLRPLPGAEEEANAIAPLINTQAFTGAKATKAAVVPQMPNAKIIHLATHGLLDEYRGLGSAIALAPTATDNGLLTAEDILKLKLNAELVVLSACNTGRGRITGDGVIGLSRSFISAGVPSIIVSLWAIPDSPTAFLMSEFYKSWQQDPKKDKAKALRQAMLATMKQRPAPENWAAFTLVGEAQ